MFMRFRPLHDRVVVRRIDAEEKTSGGIIIPDTAEREAAGGRDRRPWPRRTQRAGTTGPTRRKARRPCPVRKMVRHRSKDRRPGSSNHEGKRPSGRGRKTGSLKKAA